MVPRSSGKCRRPGAIAQLGERLDRTQEVAGSSPASSMTKRPPFPGLLLVMRRLGFILGAGYLASVDHFRGPRGTSSLSAEPISASPGLDAIVDRDIFS